MHLITSERWVYILDLAGVGGLASAIRGKQHVQEVGGQDGNSTGSAGLDGLAVSVGLILQPAGRSENESRPYRVKTECTFGTCELKEWRDMGEMAGMADATLCACYWVTQSRTEPTCKLLLQQS